MRLVMRRGQGALERDSEGWPFRHEGCFFYVTFRNTRFLRALFMGQSRSRRVAHSHDWHCYPADGC